MKRFFSKNIWIFPVTSILIGIFYYLLFREPIVAFRWFGIEVYSFQNKLPWFNWLPSFVHQFSFVLFTWLVLEKRYKWFALVFWLGVNSMFELGQALPSEYANYFPKVISNYFEYGTYSHGDMWAIIGATVVAYGLMNKYEKGVFNG